VAAATFAALLASVLFVVVALGVWAAADEVFRDRAESWITDTIAGMDATASLLTAGVRALIVALVLILAALLPGRRLRHARATDRIALVVDDGVLADAAADAVARECALDRSQVSTIMARRALTVRVTPTSGIHVDRERVTTVAAAAV